LKAVAKTAARVIDSGGPIFVGGEIPSLELLVRVMDVQRRNKPGVYARASVTYHWIQVMMCCHSSNPPSSCGVVGASVCPNNLRSVSEGDDGTFDHDDGGDTIDDETECDIPDDQCGGQEDEIKGDDAVDDTTPDDDQTDDDAPSDDA
jgi:hypothetical protein